MIYLELILIFWIKTSVSSNGNCLEIEFKGYMNIGEGEYTLSVACHEGPTHTVDCYDWIDKALSFRYFMR